MKNNIKIDGNLDIFIGYNEEELDGEVLKWNEVLIHGDSEGLRSFASLLLDVANLNQENIEDKYLPIGARKHIHLRPNIEISKSSDEVIIGRLDAKTTGEFYDRFIPKKID